MNTKESTLPAFINYQFTSGRGTRMATGDWLALKEISPDPLGFSSGVTNRLKTMVHGMAQGYLASMRYGFQIKYTSRLLLSIQNADSKKLDDHLFSFSTGNEQSPVGSAQVFVSETELLSFDDYGKAKLILELLHTTLLKIAHHNEHAVKQLNEAQRTFLRQQFYYNSYRAYQSTNEKYSCQIQSREIWGSANHRLAVTSTATKQIKFYIINTTSYTFFDEVPDITEENKWDIILNTTRIFDPLYWEAENLILFWGKDKYLFNSEKEILTHYPG